MLDSNFDLFNELHMMLLRGDIWIWQHVPLSGVTILGLKRIIWLYFLTFVLKRESKYFTTKNGYDKTHLYLLHG